jgi:hypothetical protein
MDRLTHSSPAPCSLDIPAGSEKPVALRPYLTAGLPLGLPLSQQQNADIYLTILRQLLQLRLKILTTMVRCAQATRAVRCGELKSSSATH